MDAFCTTAWAFIFIANSRKAVRMAVTARMIVAAIADLAPQVERCALPHDSKVLIPAYLTFVEPVVACLTGVALIWDRPSPSRGLRLGQLTVLVLVIKNPLVTPFVDAARARLPFRSALASAGQFALAGWALASLTGITWEWSTAHRACCKRGPVAFS